MVFGSTSSLPSIIANLNSKPTYERGLIYLVRPPDLESYFLHWETKLKTEFKDHINNPKISINHVRAVGELLYQIPAETIQPILPFDSKDSDTRE